MESAIDSLLTEIRFKIIAILRTRGYYSMPALIAQFKSHIWGHMETHMGNFFHASDYPLAKIDHEQNRFLRELFRNSQGHFLRKIWTPGFSKSHSFHMSNYIFS